MEAMDEEDEATDRASVLKKIEVAIEKEDVG